MCCCDELCPIAIARGQQEGEETLSLRCRMLPGRGDETVHCADALQFYVVLRQICSLLCYYAYLEVFQNIYCPNSMVLKEFYLPAQTTRYVCFLVVSNTFDVLMTCSPTLLRGDNLVSESLLHAKRKCIAEPLTMSCLSCMSCLSYVSPMNCTKLLLD